MVAAPHSLNQTSTPHVDASDEACPLRIFGIYADLPTHANAMRLLHWLAGESTGETRISTVWFSFERLVSQTERDVAAAWAAQAHMFLYSGYGDKMPPAVASLLIEARSGYLGAFDQPIVALVCTPADNGSKPTEAEKFLQELVLRSGQSLFLQRV